MPLRFELNLFQTFLLFFAAAEIGAVSCMLVTNNISAVAAMLQIVAMLFVSLSILISARKRQRE